MKKTIYWTVLIAAILAGGVFIYSNYYGSNCRGQRCLNPNNQVCIKFHTEYALTLEEAKAIALQSACGKEGKLAGGKFGEGYDCNYDSGTWLIDIIPNQPRASCAPICEISVVTKQAEVNWRCTGGLTPQ